jgi:hypothetical protein
MCSPHACVSPPLCACGLQLVAANDGKRAVLLSHSMGVRCVQYFLSYVKYRRADLGQAWLDAHVHTVRGPRASCTPGIRTLVLTLCMWFLGPCLLSLSLCVCVWVDGGGVAGQFVAVSPTFLGVPKALRIVLSGDKMGLDGFIDDEEALVIGRNFGRCVAPARVSPRLPSPRPFACATAVPGQSWRTCIVVHACILPRVRARSCAERR